MACLPKDEERPASRRQLITVWLDIPHISGILDGIEDTMFSKLNISLFFICDNNDVLQEARQCRLPAKKHTSKLKAAHHWHVPSGESDLNKPIKGRKVEKADTNVVSIKLDKLISPSNMHTGDPVYCTSCQSILSNISKLAPEANNKIWECEFCSVKNCFDIDPEEVPKVDDVTYMLEPALSTTASGAFGMDESLVIFCIDISGSMCVTTAVPGIVKLRGSQSQSSMGRFNTERSDQYFPNQPRNVTYVSRLQALQAAVDHQLQEMAKNHMKRGVALVTFNSEVTIIGDGHGSPVTVTGDKLKNEKELIEVGEEQTRPHAIADSRKLLGDKLFSLEEGGQTALGPAMIIATTMAAAQPGSKVILCTDGMANTGLGRLDNMSSDIQSDQVEKFYRNIGNRAIETGVSISVISIKGTDCKLVQLGRVSDMTGGQVNIVDPMNLTEEFSTILANRIIATNIVATFILHKELYFKHEETKASRVVKIVGNATSDTQIMFEYGIKKSFAPESICSDQVTESEVLQEETVEKKKPNKLPFQLQIVYTDTEGNKALRVLTQNRKVTRDRNLAERKMNLKVIGKHAAKKSAEIALGGDYTIARENAMMHQRMAWRYTNCTDEGLPERSRYRRCFRKIKKMENYINESQQDERNKYGMTYSDEDDAYNDDIASTSSDTKPAKTMASLSALPKCRGGESKSIFSSIFGKNQKKFIYNSAMEIQ
ncbi:hypothetical protein ScPMuIL_013032 [Solemya velum]